jgi:hypothetical protein
VTQALAKSVQEWCQTIASAPGQTSCYPYYVSGPDDNPGLLLFEEQGIGGASFSVTAKPTVFQTKFAPTLSTAQTSTNDSAPHRVFWSKPSQPEHVPLGQLFDIGARSKSILRIVALRDALFVFKQDGVFRITGDAGIFSVGAFDPTLILLSKSSLAVLNNRIYAICTKGVYAISESGATLVSDLVADIVRKFIEQPSPTVYAAASDIDGLFYLYMSASGLTDTCLVYCPHTGAWTQLYVNDGVTGQVSFASLPAIQIGGLLYRLDLTTRNIYKDDTLDATEASAIGSLTAGAPSPAHKYLINITAVNAGGKTITATSLGGPALAVGSLIRENGSGGSVYTVTAVNTGVYTLAISKGPDDFTFVTGHAYQWVSAPSLIEWNEFDAGTDSELKSFSEIAVLLTTQSTVNTATTSAYTDLDSTVRAMATMTTTTHASPPSTIRGLVAPTQRTARRISVQLSHTTPGEFMYVKGIAYGVDPMPGSRPPV